MMNSSSAGRASYPRAEHPRDAEHVTIYYDRAEFAAWPFSHGFWAFSGGGLLISFSRGPCRYEQRHDVTHEVVDALSGEYVTLRSVDGGRTWPLDTLQVLGTHQGLERELLGGAAKLAPYEAVGVDQAFSAAIRMTRMGGITVLAGVFRKPMESFDPEWLFRRDLTVVAAKGPRPLLTSQGVPLVHEYMARGIIRPEAAVAVYPLARAGEAFRALSAAECLKAVIVPG